MVHLRDFYYKKFRITTVLTAILGLYFLVKYFTYEKEMEPQAFMDLLKMHSF